MSDQTDREAQLREIAKKRVRVELPGMDRVDVRRDRAYRGTSGASLPFDIYCPDRDAVDPLPAVVIPFGYRDPEGRIRMFGPVTSWAQLIAASGMAAVLYGTDAPGADVHQALAHLRINAAALGLDPARIALFATSGNVPVALAALIQDPGIACAALLYGYTLDLDGATTVADASAQYLFVNACAGKSVDDLPSDVPLMFVRAGRDQFHGLNDALDRVISRALARNLPLTLVNHATGVHGFDLEDDSATTRAIVTQVLAFLRWNLEPASPRLTGATP